MRSFLTPSEVETEIEDFSKVKRLFLFRVRTAQQSQTPALFLAQLWSYQWSAQNWSVCVTISFFKTL